MATLDEAASKTRIRLRPALDASHYQLNPGVVDAIRDAINGDYVLGNSEFQMNITYALGRWVENGKAGRPRTYLTAARLPNFSIY